MGQQKPSSVAERRSGTGRGGKARAEDAGDAASAAAGRARAGETAARRRGAAGMARGWP